MAPMTPEQWRADVGQPIEARRAVVKLRSMNAAAERAQISPTLWRQLETGRRHLGTGLIVAPTPEPETVEKVGAALQWSEEWLDRLLVGEQPVTWEDELLNAEAHLGEAAADFERLGGGGEVVREYRYWRARVDDLRQRLGMPSYDDELAAKANQPTQPAGLAAIELQITMLRDELGSLARSVQLLLEEELPRLKDAVAELRAAREA